VTTGWALAVSALHVTDLFAVGIGFDIAGAYLLARGLLLKPHGLYVRFTIAGADTRFVDEVRDRAMAVVGLAALVFGFTIQALGYALSLAVEPPDEKSVTSALVAIALATLAVLVIVAGEKITRRRRLRSLFLAVARADTTGDGPAGAPTVRILVTGAPEIGVEREHDESDEAYARRAFDVEHVRTEPPPARAHSR
jgi:hypothetical protein